MSTEGTLELVETSPKGMDPVIGQATTNLGDYLVRTGKIGSSEDFQRVRDDALNIVRRCLPFNGPDGDRTGLVVGYVQSGKTMSMETVVSIARDNGCRLIILLAGVTTNLLQQNAERFKKDLRTANEDGGWAIITSQAGKGSEASAQQQLSQACGEWRSDLYAESEKRTLIFAVLKNHAHLDWMQRVLTSGGIDLRGMPALVLDDEADQAGLNVSADEDSPSKTYVKIGALRASLPHHTYLQYTATPQAPLLISIDDMLSPAFAELVSPGAGYTGGETFFGDAANAALIKAIPAVDHFKPGKPPEDPPDSLTEALATFFVGCAVARNRKYPRVRSMLVHPSQRTDDQQQFNLFVTAILGRWHTDLIGNDVEARDQALEELKVGYDELTKTQDDLPAFEDLIPALRVSLGRKVVKVVNSADASEVDWEGAEEHVLVGGEKLNRGYTVEGLTVTYMPRDAGGFNADTLQQRARFFGYKGRYLGLCRLYLHPVVAQAFVHYVRHERDIRKQLSEFRGKPLRTWRRAFFLDAKMKPTRANVLSEPLQRVKRNQWWRQSYPHADTATVKANTALVAELLADVPFASDERWHAKHRTADVAIAKVIDFLSRYHAPIDSHGLVGSLVMLTDLMDRDASCQALVVLMDGGETRDRKLDGDRVPLFQGRSSARTKQGYVGDEHVREAQVPTLQIHRVHLTTLNKVQYFLALFIPGADDVVVQETDD